MPCPLRPAGLVHSFAAIIFSVGPMTKRIAGCFPPTPQTGESEQASFTGLRIERDGQMYNDYARP
jgi:hypothetical protein